MGTPPKFREVADLGSPVVLAFSGELALRDVGSGGGSVCDLVATGLTSTSSISSDAVKDCLSFDGDVIGDRPDLDGGVDGLPTTVVGDDGEEGQRKGEARGELNDNEGLYADV